MANIVKYNSRITLKYDSLTEWNKVKASFIPLKGEVCVVNPSENLAAGAGCLIKVGDGKTTFEKLPYLSGLAADVYDWAKAKDVEYNDDNSHIEFKKSNGDVIDFVDLSSITSAISDLGERVGDLEDDFAEIPGIIDGAVDTLGESLGKTFDDVTIIKSISYNKGENKVSYETQTIPSGDTSNKGLVQLYDGVDKADSTLAATAKAVYTANEEAKSAGSVASTALDTANAIISGTDGTVAYRATRDGKNNVIETYYATADDLKKLSDALDDVSNVMNFEGVVEVDPTTITSGYNNGDVVIYGSKEYVFNGKTSKFVEFGDTSTQNQAIEDLESAVADIKSYATIKGDSGTTTAAVVNDELTISGRNKLTATVTKDTVTIDHDPTTVSTPTSTDTVELTPSVNTDTFTAIDSISYDDYGHVTSFNTKTVTVDVTDINSAISNLGTSLGNLKYFSKINGHTAEKPSDEFTVAGGTTIDVTDSTEDDKITIAHANVTRSDGTKTTLTPAHSGTFEIIESVTTNAQGHVTKVQPRTIQLPAAYDDSSLSSRVIELENNTWKTVTRNKVTQVDDNTNGNFTTGLQDSKGNSTLNKSDLTIGTDVIGYIIWDCGSASKNI
jgi:hypothetical protein